MEKENTKQSVFIKKRQRALQKIRWGERDEKILHHIMLQKKLQGEHKILCLFASNVTTKNRQNSDKHPNDTQKT